MKHSLPVCLFLFGGYTAPMLAGEKLNPVNQAIADALEKGPVHLAVAADFDNPENDPSEITQANEYYAQVAESAALERFGKNKNFTMVDRITTEKVLKELKFSQAVSNDLSSAKQLGVTHLQLLRGLGKIDSNQMVVTVRLVETETGKVLATRQIHR